MMKLALLLTTQIVATHGLTLSSMPCSRSRVVAHTRAYVVAATDYDKTKEGDYPHPSDSDYKFGDITLRVIRDMTGNKDYKLGDGSKAIASATSDAAEAAAAAVITAGGTAAEAGAAAKQVIDDSGYQFGDLTKGAIKGFEETVRDATGNEGYKFGDVTKNLAKGLFGALEKGAANAKKTLDE
uniref:Uncharacterized protein n=1 Tax=Haptolina ericina TaxID=156174 RepID=A0A7S3B590_9EUKA|mmetsp:Transcript_48117/g.108397  ORF Transcript_48117/g.108397 Transcript_48117/m.108397 type:complete len:183 (+) Transcript_48117:14-562(+)